jgi:hypothetical protein
MNQELLTHIEELNEWLKDAPVQIAIPVRGDDGLEQSLTGRVSCVLSDGCIYVRGGDVKSFISGLFNGLDERDALNIQNKALYANAFKLADEIDLLDQHVADLQSGMYINCVYCGHRYGPRETTAATLPDAKTQTMADALTEHISKCPKHPLAKALLELADERERCAKIVYDMWNDAEVTEVIAAIRGETA